MIEINVAAKPKPPKDLIALELNRLYRLKNGIVILTKLTAGGGLFGGKVMFVPAGLGNGQNPVVLFVGNENHLWVKDTGRFYMYDQQNDWPYHAVAMVDEVPAQAPPAPDDVHVNEPRDVLWAFWKAGGFLQWRSKLPGNVWKPYYDHHNLNVDGWLHLSNLNFCHHYANYYIRRKP